MNIPISDDEAVPRVESLPRVVNTIEEKVGGDQVPDGTVEGGETNNERNTDRSHDGSRDAIDNLQVDHQATSVLPVVNMIQEETTSKIAGDQSKKEDVPLSDVKTDELPCTEDDRDEEELDFSTYRHEREELYAEDVDQHMAVLPDIVMPTF